MNRQVSSLIWFDFVIGACAGALASATMFMPVMLGSRIIPYDYEYYHFPLWRLIFDGIKAHTFPDYDAFCYSGMPFLANTQSMLFYPPAVVYLYAKALLSPSFTICDSQFINLFHYTVGYLGTFIWVRYRSTSATLAHAIALSAVFGGAWLANTQHAGFIGALAWFPWLLVATDHLISDPRPMRVIPLALALALVQLAGFLPIVLIENLLWGIYCVAALLKQSVISRGTALQTTFNRLMLLIAAQALHILLTAIS